MTCALPPHRKESNYRGPEASDREPIPLGLVRHSQVTHNTNNKLRIQFGTHLWSVKSTKGSLIRYNMVHLSHAMCHVPDTAVQHTVQVLLLEGVQHSLRGIYYGELNRCVGITVYVVAYVDQEQQQQQQPANRTLCRRFRPKWRTIGSTVKEATAAIPTNGDSCPYFLRHRRSLVLSYLRRAFRPVSDRLLRT